jgi:glycosyltransferase involved in cell wall biosynthesis
MDLIFFDPIPWDYDVSTPAERPLGGSQSALCYLAAELARRGHQVRLVNNIQSAREVQGVPCIPERELTADLLAQPRDAMIVLNGPAELGPQLRRYLPPSTPLVLWTQHSSDQPAVASLDQADVRAAWDHVVCISNWQRDRYLEKFPLDPNRVSILRNAIAPAFESLFATPDDLIQAKPAQPVLAYTSTPFRGLNVLAAVFRPLHEEFPDAELQVYSSMNVYHVPPESDQFGALYERCRSLPGARYLGSIPQQELATALRGVTILSYPNTFAETSCIAVMEAMAAGAHVVTTDLGALPETTLGRATLVPPMKDNDASAFGSHYYQVLRSVLNTWRENPAAFAAAQFEQVREINAACTWSVRAIEWESALRSLKS